ncbi:protein kinase [Streptomyces sp. NPDC003077]|uniref:serine/threonine-protein kinase n=1 Tax=Streptomyces sp. NPDC003077 TaxID=3154443 RepID=UPI0033B22AD9
MRVGTRVAGRYRLTRRPLIGGMGEVWPAHDEELGRDVALKREPPGSGGATAVDRLGAEARAVARFRHPHVVTLYDRIRVRRLGRTESWLVMEYVPGGSLADRPPLPGALAAHVGAQLADALGALHAAGLVHCDVKPGNVVVSGDHVVKLTDFGAAYRLGTQETVTPNTGVGFTPGYAAPEVIAGRPPLPASDVYSLGATVYALVTRGRVRPGADVPLAAGPFPGPLGELLTAMLREDPARRPGVTEARERLRELAGRPEDLPPFPAPAPRTTLPASGGGRRRALPRVPGAALGGTAVLAVAALVAWGLADRPAGSPGGPADGHRPAARASATRSPAGLARLIGDPRTLDPCALTSAPAFARWGDAQLVSDYGNFDRCDVLLSSGGDDTVDVEVRLTTGPPPASPRPTGTTRRIGVANQPADRGECGRTLTLAGLPHLGVDITAKALDGDEHPLCAIADTATRLVTTRLDRDGGPLPRRPDAAPGSLAARDACTLPPTAALRTATGAGSVETRPGFGNWSCSWRAPAGGDYVRLRFDRPQLVNGDHARTTHIAGRPAVVLPRDEGPGSCSTDVAGPPYIPRDGGHAVETVLVTVGDAGPDTRACALATALTAALVPRLPPA